MDNHTILLEPNIYERLCYVSSVSPKKAENRGLCCLKAWIRVKRGLSTRGSGSSYQLFHPS